MNKLKTIGMLLVLATIIASCGSSNSVVSNNLIQKRKYNKGFFLNKKSNYRDAKNDLHQDRVAAIQQEKTKKLSFPLNAIKSKESIVKGEGRDTGVEKMSKTANSSHKGVDVYQNSSKKSANVKSASSLKYVSSTKKLLKTKNRVTKKGASSSDVGLTVLYVILAIILPPLAVFLYEGVTNRFWITLILWLVGIGVGIWLLGPSLAWACGLVAAIYAILIVLGVI